MKHFKVSDIRNRVVFELELNNRITVICGDSAQGKTMLVKFIELVDKSTKLISNGDFNIRHINDDMILNGYRLNSNDIYIMDEYDGINNLAISNIINNRKYNFILITRNTTMSHISYDISDIYTFSNSGKYHKLIRKYEKINKDIDKTKLNKIVTEDSGSGNEFYKNYNNFKLLSSKSNSKILNYIEDGNIFIVDSLGFGPYIKLYLQKSEYNNTFLIYPKSFEYLILTSGIISYKLCNLSINRAETTGLQNTLERNYYKELRWILKQYNIKFSKNYLDEWFNKSEVIEQINAKINNQFDINLFELNKHLIRSDKLFNWD